jgi:hypothetical protein
MSENEKVGELHGCIVSARLFNILAVYAAGSKLVDCTVKPITKQPGSN